MNTFGKTLVICNLVAAIAAAALFTVGHIRAINWKNGFDEVSDRNVVLQTNRDMSDREKSESNQEVKREMGQKEAALVRIKELEDTFKAKIADFEVKLEEKDQKIQTGMLNLEKTQDENQRLKLINDGLATSLKVSERAKLAERATSERYYKKAEDLKNLNNGLQTRNEKLSDIIRQKDKLLAEVSTRGGPPGEFVRNNLTVNPNGPNPPATRVKGIIEKIDRNADGNLLQLSVGSEHGVGKDNTLDVYRTEPRAQYLGTIRILQVYERRSVGRLVRAVSASPLREGDIVVDSIGSP